MKLIKIRIKGYKHLKDVEVIFNNEENILQSNSSVRFFTGLNGSGKSAFLEGIALIFSRIIQDELPGFYFELEYEIDFERETRRVKVSPNKNNSDSRVKITLTIDEEEIEEPQFSKYRYLHPSYIIAYSSGQNGSLSNIFIKSARDSLYSDIYDASNMVFSNKTREQREREELLAKINLQRLNDSPLCLFLDNDTSLFALAAFFSINPNDDVKYFKMKQNLLKMITSEFEPISVSFIADSEMVENYKKGENENYISSKLCSLFSSKQEVQATNKGISVDLLGDDAMCSWLTVNEVHKEHGITEDITAAFMFDNYSGNYGIQKLSEQFKSPYSFMAVLIQAYNNKLLKGVHFTYRHKESNELLDERALSDGEYMWLARMGLILMSRQYEQSQCLFLLDEPDVHLNEHWNAQFIALINDMICDKPEIGHEIIVATHSSMILTDAKPNQICHFKKNADKEVVCENTNISTFGASRNEITYALFDRNTAIGEYSNNLISDVIYQSKEPKDVEKYIDIVGPGYMRFRLLDRYQDLKNKEDKRDDIKN